MIDLSDLERFLGGNASSTEGVQLSLMALNVLINTMPASAYPSKKTSFFPPDIQRDATSQHAAGKCHCSVYIVYADDYQAAEEVEAVEAEE